MLIEYFHLELELRRSFAPTSTTYLHVPFEQE